MFLKSLEDVNLQLNLLHDVSFEIENHQTIEDYYYNCVKKTFIQRDSVNLSIVSVKKGKLLPNLVIIPGRGECEYKYSYLLYCLKELNINIYVLFVRGQGHSSRYFHNSPRCHIDKFSDYTDDLDFMLKHFGIKNYNLMAFSLGCLISLSYYHRYDNKPKRMALLAPFIYPYFKLPDSVLYSFIKSMSCTFFKKTYTPHGGNYSFIPFEKNHHTHCRYRYEKYHRHYAENPNLASGGPTYNFVYECMREQKYLNSSKLNFKIPVLSVISSADMVVSAPHAIDFFAKHANDAFTPLVYIAKGAYHDLINEESKYQAKSIGAALEFLIGDNLK